MTSPFLFRVFCTLKISHSANPAHVRRVIYLKMAHRDALDDIFFTVNNLQFSTKQLVRGFIITQCLTI